jgi:bifunctional DNase/RNase
VPSETLATDAQSRTSPVLDSTLMSMREVELHRLIRSDRSPECQLYLKEKLGERVFPVIIHQTEMAEIHRKVLGESFRRPMTHDLIASIVKASGLTLANIHITKLEDAIFFAQMNFEAEDGRAFSVDARPSDAVAVATGMGAPIFAAESILASIGQVESEESAGPPEATDD